MDNPIFSGTFSGDSGATDHNLYVKGNEVFLSNYTRGIRVADISDIAAGNLVDTGSFDTYPSKTIIPPLMEFGVYILISAVIILL